MQARPEGCRDHGGVDLGPSRPRSPPGRPSRCSLRYHLSHSRAGSPHHQPPSPTPWSRTSTTHPSRQPSSDPPSWSRIPGPFAESYAAATKTLGQRFQEAKASATSDLGQLVAQPDAPSSSSVPNPRAGILKKSRPKGQSKPTARVDSSFHTPVPAISPSSYVPYQAGEKRKGVASSSIGDSSSDADSDMESVDGVDDHPSSAEAGPVKAELLVGQYVQVSSSSTKQEYKNCIFRISSVGKRSSDLEYLDDFETT